MPGSAASGTRASMLIRYQVARSDWRKLRSPPDGGSTRDRNKPDRRRRNKASSTFLAHLFVAFFHGCFARQFDPAFVVDADALDPDFVTDLDDVLSLFDAEVGQFADVHEAVLTGEDFDKASEFLDRDDFAAINFAHFNFRHHAFDGFAGN